MNFLRPDGKQIEINSKKEAADHIRKSCDDCKKYDYTMHVLPTKLDTNNPSTTLYMDVNIIITIDGNTNRNNFLYVKCSDNEILIHNSFPSSVR